MKTRNKILLAIAITILITWNLALSYVVFFQDKNPSNQINDPEHTNISQTATYTTTDLTKAAQKGALKAVGIRTSTGAGSGAIYRSERNGDKSKVTIVTNYHVVTTEKTVNVLFANEQEVEGRVVGGDIYTDLAIVEVEVDFAIEAFSLGDSAAVTVGEWVLAIGSPLGFEFYGTVSEGIISGKDRIIGVDLNRDGRDDWDMQVLQTTAAINPGNSGGPLINLNGDLIGINSMKIADSKIEGMGFAIPINEVIPIITQLMETGEVKRPLVGLSGRSLSEYSNAHRSYLGLPLDVVDGVVVVDVIKDGAADEAEIKANDIIVKINDVDIESFKNFRMELYKHQSGEEITLTVVRGSENFEVTVTLK